MSGAIMGGVIIGAGAAYGANRAKAASDDQIDAASRTTLPKR